LVELGIVIWAIIVLCSRIRAILPPSCSNSVHPLESMSRTTSGMNSSAPRSAESKLKLLGSIFVKVVLLISRLSCFTFICVTGGFGSISWFSEVAPEPRNLGVYD
jgi:hypothetical protein